jgi:class 3 adenylate cyclase/tetratricopeptide (TPR) repeat protein
MIASGGASRSGLAGEPGFTLGGLEVRPATREVVSADAADVLEPRVMQVLVTLAGRRGQVVSRDDLIDACWGGRAVGDDAINRCIQALRRLGETRGGFSILTVPRVGYRLDEGGDAVAARDAIPPPAAGRRAATDERRHVTVLSCGLARETGSALDPEDWYAVTRAWRHAASEAAVGFGGHVEKARGDRLVVYFGYPEAQEDAAVRAVNAGLAIAQVKGSRASVRVGVHAGAVVVAPTDAGEAEMFGEAPDLAARVQDGAPPGAVMITGPVHDLVSGLVAVEPLDALLVDGPGPPVRLYRAMSTGPSSGRGFAPREPTPFMGRDDEARLLTSRWERTQEGEGQFVLVVGEPGIGKSRLVQEFKARLQDGAHRAIECAGAPLFASTPFHAVIQILRQGLGWRDADTPAERVAGLERALAQTGLKPDEAVPLVADLVGLPVPPTYAPLMLAPDQRRKRLLAALAAWVFAASQARPLLLVAEDVHWIDPSSLELLQTLAEQGATSPVMLLCTARPEFQAPWPARSHHARITLAGLAARPMRDLVDGLVARAGMADATAEAVVERADGVPLFAEELTRLMLDGEGNREPGLVEAGRIPATLLDSLAARLDRLGAGKDVAQLGSVLGRTFSHDLLQAVSPLSEQDLQSGLARLADAELIYVRGMAPEATYQFKHALIQDAAYATLVKASRRVLHASVAQTLTTRFGGLAEARPEVLARHWTEAGDADKAIAAWTKAAEAAEARHAFVEAEEGYRRALAIFPAKPETPARDQQELDLGLALIRVTATTQGPQSAETVAIGARNHVLAERGGFLGANTAMRAMAFTHHLTAADWTQVAAHAEQMRAFAARLVPETEAKWFRFAHAMAHFTQFNCSYYCGDLLTAEAQYQLWHGFHEGGGFDQQLSTTMALGNGAQLARCLGRPDLARERMAQARLWVGQRDSAYETMLAEALDGLLQVGLRDVDRAEAVAADAVRICDEKGFPQVAAWARAVLGWARAQRGAPREGIDLIRKAMADLGAMQTRVSMPFFLTLLAEAQALDGAVDDAFASFEEALDLNPDERLHRPYTLICRGELRARMRHAELAEADFRDAIALARTMSAAGYELRAATGLARLLGERGEGAAARDLLVPLLEAVAAAPETADVADARTLVSVLAG